MIKTLEQQRHFVALVLILLVAWGLRACRLGAQELRGDEAGSWIFVVSEPGPTELLERIVREGDPHPPLHHWFLQGWVRVFGESEWALRMPSALLSLILVALLYKFGAHAGSPAVGLGAAVIAALHPFQIWLAQDVRHMYQLAILFVLLATLRLTGMLRERANDWWIYVGSGTLAMYSHYYAFFGLLAHGVYVFTRRDTNRIRWILATGAVVLLVLPWAAVILPVYVRGQLADPSVIPPLHYLSTVAADFSLGPVVVHKIGLPVAGLLLVLAVHGVAFLRRGKTSAWTAFMIAWPLLTLVGIYAVTTQRGTFNSFYFLVAFPAVYLLVSAGWYALLRRPNGTIPAALVALLGAALMLFALNNYFFDPQWSKNRGLREVAEILQSQARAGDVFIANFPDPAQDYYLRKLNIARAMLPEESHSNRVETLAALHQLAEQYQRLWFVPIEAFQWDKEAIVLELLNRGYVREAEFRVGKLRLLRFASNPASALGSRDVNAAFVSGPKLVLAHVSVNGQEAVESLAVGDHLRVSLLWSAPDTHIGHDYIVFVHLLDADGNLLASHDGPPVNGHRATSTWHPREIILDVHVFEMPTVLDSDIFTLSVGLYASHTEKRQVVLGGEDSVAIFEYSAESSMETSE